MTKAVASGTFMQSSFRFTIHHRETGPNVHVKAIIGVAETKATPPAVDLHVVQPQPRGPRTFEVKLDRVAHFPQARTVVIRLKSVSRDGDDFITTAPTSVTTRVTLPKLKGKQLSGYRIIVTDAQDNPLGDWTWP
jgi:hypothetical protein